MGETVILVDRNVFARYERPMDWSELEWDAENATKGLTFSSIDKWQQHHNKAVFVNRDGRAHLLATNW